MKALLIVDLQNDFCPGGALPAPEGNRVVPVINRIMDKFDLVIASKDWHPRETYHFTRWPVHCVRDTPGAAFHPDLQTAQIQFTFLKGTGEKDDGYSAFEATNENLMKYLNKNHVDELYIAGLTTEYCVKETALDAVRNEFNTLVISDAIAGVHEHEEDVPEALGEMKQEGVKLIESGKLFQNKTNNINTYTI